MPGFYSLLIRVGNGKSSSVAKISWRAALWPFLVYNIPYELNLGFFVNI